MRYNGLREEENGTIQFTIHVHKRNPVFTQPNLLEGSKSRGEELVQQSFLSAFRLEFLFRFLIRDASDLGKFSKRLTDNSFKIDPIFFNHIIYSTSIEPSDNKEHRETKEKEKERKSRINLAPYPRKLRTIIANNILRTKLQGRKRKRKRKISETFLVH